MSLTFSTIEGRSRGFYLTVATLVAFTLIGFATFMMSYVEGHKILGTSNIIPWGMPIVIAIYLIGLSAGSLILSSLTYVFQKEEYRPIARMAVYMAMVLILGAMISIALDLGRPEKTWRLFMFFVLNNMRSMFALNGILYGVYFAISLVYLASILAEKSKLTRAIGILAIVWAALVHMGTGAIFGFIAARPLFYSPIKPFEFLAAAMVSGLALLLIAVMSVFKCAQRKFDKTILFSLSRLLLVLVIVLSVTVSVDKVTHLYTPHRDQILWLLTGPFSWAFWVLQVGFAYVLPLFLLLHPRTRKSIKGVLAATVLVVIGIFGERFVLVIPGMANPLPFYPGKIEGVWGKTGSFPFVPAECLMSLGVFALMGLVFLFGLKYLELLPADESSGQISVGAKNL